MDSQTIVSLFALVVLVFASRTLVNILSALNQLISIATENQTSQRESKAH